MAILAFSNSIMVSTNTTRLIKNPMLLKVCPKTIVFILSYIVTSKNFDVSIKEIGHHFIKKSKARKNLIFSPKQVNPSHTGITINKSNKPPIPRNINHRERPHTSV
ncbi:hypothetical protein CsSME_00037784 [Camellia sinensis var. sinensis]